MDLGIVNTKEIIAAVNDKLGLDLSGYSLTVLKRRLVDVMSFYKIRSVDVFINQIQNDNIDFEEFQNQLMIDATELLRDPATWREIRDNYLPKLLKKGKPNILMPHITSGEELYSLTMLLNEVNLLNKVDITTFCPSAKRTAIIKDGGNYSIKDLEIAEGNYIRFAGIKEFDSYYQKDSQSFTMDSSLIKNVNFESVNISQEEIVGSYDFIIFRNVLIQYNLPLYDKVIEQIIKSLKVGGFLVIGSKETLEYSESRKKMELVNPSEKIYKKIAD